MNKSGRTIDAVRDKSFKSLFFRWETLLILLFLAVNIMNISISANYLNANNLLTAISTFLVKGFIAFPMAFILVLGEIDISVGSIVALSATVLGYSYNKGVPMPLAILLGVLTGLLCGMFNGLILTKFTELAPMIVTLATQTLYRGMAEMILKDQSASKLHSSEFFYNIYYGKLFGIPYILIVFFVLAIIFGVVLHKTIYGRYLYAIGLNRDVAYYSGVPVQKVRFIAYSLMGLICGVAAVYYASWMGTVRSDIAIGYELEAVSMVVLGGISAAGGKGNFPGTVIAIFTVGLLKYGLGVVNVNSQTILMILGIILIVVVMSPNLKFGRLSPLKREHKKSH
ncbi:MAG: ABC transporter permease [Clostridiaceae bacterium]|nr:ABC transporter permease [Clostridiaceae bacterium]